MVEPRKRHFKRGTNPVGETVFTYECISTCEYTPRRRQLCHIHQKASQIGRCAESGSIPGQPPPAPSSLAHLSDGYTTARVDLTGIAGVAADEMIIGFLGGHDDISGDFDLRKGVTGWRTIYNLTHGKTSQPWSYCSLPR